MAEHSFLKNGIFGVLRLSFDPTDHHLPKLATIYPIHRHAYDDT